ncbi:MFS transporter [Rhizobium bangladeshense]|uniref:MFS transporter n=1 Tax=Rhizobium bangladeshense TaxID=1138189 RepID=UPI001C82DF53|nr:MFS transporter [Rhizobium bangladeshense]MBX4870337.1 MFS transporter [Rhizobium bangladeshense]
MSNARIFVPQTRVMAVAFQFFINGVVYGTWATNILHIRRSFGLSEFGLSIVFLTMGAAAVLIMSLTGYLVQIFGSRRISILSCLFFPAALCFVFVAPNHIALLVGVGLFGAANGSMDVSMNDQGTNLGKRGSDPVISLLHGFSSIGALAGSLLSYWWIGRGYHPLVQAIALLVGTLMLSWRLFPHLDLDADRSRISLELGALGNGRLILLGFLSFLTMMSDGAIADWSTIYLEDYWPTSPQTAVLGYLAFAVFMIVGRISGDRIGSVIGDRAMIAISGGLMSAGMTIALSIPFFAAALAGFSLLGIGIANLVPIIFRNASEMVPDGLGIAFVSVCGYSGFLVGPPIIGGAAGAVGLNKALLIVSAVGATLAFASVLFQGRKRPPASR